MVELLVALTVAFSFSSQAASQRHHEADLELVRAVADAADENRARFPFGTVEFRFQDGKAKNLDEAKVGTLSDSHEAKCRYVYHDSHAYFEKRHTLASLVAKTRWTSASSSSSTLSNFRLLTNGKLTLQEYISAARDGSSENYGHSIDAGTRIFYQDAFFPLSLSFPEEKRRDMVRYFRLLIGGTPGLAIESMDPEATLDGLRVLSVTLGNSTSRVTFWVDLERGAIPMLMRFRDAKGTGFDRFHGQIRQVPGHGWLPFEETDYFVDGMARRTLIDRVDFDKPPGPEAFRMKTSGPARIGNKAAGVVYPPLPYYDLDHLPPPGSGRALPFKVRNTIPGPDTRLPGERDAPRHRYLYWGGIVTLAAFAGLVASRRFRR